MIAIFRNLYQKTHWLFDHHITFLGAKEFNDRGWCVVKCSDNRRKFGRLANV